MNRPLATATFRADVGSPASIFLSDVSYSYGSQAVIENVTLDVAAGSFLTLLGASGSGKTTLLRLVAGLADARSGAIFIGGRDVSHVPADRRDIGVVFQNYALFPHLTVHDNVAFPLKLRKAGSTEVRRRVGDVLAKLDLETLAGRRPAELSGGQQQRVALARAIVFGPQVLLMDEPLGALDRRLRQSVQREIRRLQQDLGIATIYVTHDQDEAFALSDRIAVMNAGRIVQVGTPQDLYGRPKNLFVAQFLGDLNRLPARILAVAGDRMEVVICGERTLAVPAIDNAALGDAIVAGVRPEHLRLVPVRGTEAGLEARLRAVTFKGSSWQVELASPAAAEPIFAHVARPPAFAPGDACRIVCETSDWHFFA